MYIESMGITESNCLNTLKELYNRKDTINMRIVYLTMTNELDVRDVYKKQLIDLDKCIEELEEYKSTHNCNATEGAVYIKWANRSMM